MKIAIKMMALISGFILLSMSCNESLEEEKEPKDDQDKINYGSLTDNRDNHVYKTLKFGQQTWMAENLAFLPDVHAPKNSSTQYPRYYVYGYNGTDPTKAKLEENFKTYGVLYNWPAALVVCPDGWHLASANEWDELEDYLVDNGYGYGEDVGAIAKAIASTEGWNYFSADGTVGNHSKNNNSSGFSAVPGGFYFPTEFCYLNDNASWWTSTNNETKYAWFRALDNDDSELGGSVYIKDAGFSVRCVKD